MFYATAYPYGLASNDNGDLIRELYAFPKRARRDEWVSAGQPYTTAPDHREALSSRAPGLRREIRRGNVRAGA